MKALAAEVVRKLGKRLQWLSIRVRELTGDMQMTKAEIAETQIIVTTPEKWDVVTRKPTGEGELATVRFGNVKAVGTDRRLTHYVRQQVRLLIIDEVHLLDEERGAVIETIVARTLRQVESSQSVIRIVGLSATLPNYVDVADFLRSVPALTCAMGSEFMQGFTSCWAFLLRFFVPAGSIGATFHWRERKTE